MTHQLRRKLLKVSRVLQHFITPGLLHSQERYMELLLEIVTSGSDWLDVGCGQRALAEWLPDSLSAERELVSRCHRAVGVDSGDPRPHRSLEEKYAASVEKLPFMNASFSVVTANMVVEHLANPEVALGEIYRVLRPGGIFAFHTPNARTPLIRLGRMVPSTLKTRIVSFIDGRKDEDIFPTFYRLNEAVAIRSMAEKSGFIVLKLSYVESSPVLVMFGPLVLVEMGAIRLFRLQRFAYLRPDFLVVLQKPILPLTDALGDREDARQ